MPRQEDTIWKVKGLNPDEGDNIFFILKSLLKSILYIILWNLCIVALYNCDSSLICICGKCTRHLKLLANF